MTRTERRPGEGSRGGADDQPAGEVTGRDDLLDDHVPLRSEGYDWRGCAERLGMTYTTFERAMPRARAAGDPRARRTAERDVPR